MLEPKTDWKFGDIVEPSDLNRIEENEKELGEEITELKKSVSDGKKVVASAITAKGQATEQTATFQTMADHISKIQTGINIDTSQINANENYLAYGATAYGKASYGEGYEIINGKAFPPYSFYGHLRTGFKYGVTNLYTYTGLKNENNMLPFDGLTNVTGRFFGLVVMGNVHYQKNNGGSSTEILNIPTPVFLTQTNNTITKSISYGGGTIISTCILKPDNYLYVIINCSGVDSSTSDIDIVTDLIVYPIYDDYGNRYHNYVTYETDNGYI